MVIIMMKDIIVLVNKNKCYKYRMLIGQLHYIKLNIVTDFKSSTHFVDEELPFEFDFIHWSCYVQVYTYYYLAKCLNTRNIKWIIKFGRCI